MREVIKWPIRVWLLFLSLILAVVLSVGVVLSDVALILFTTTLLVITLLFSWNSRLIISASGELLIVGGAKIERKFIREIIPLNEVKMKYERGAGINPRAFLAIRFWVKGGMKVLLDDPRDPTPYWLVSTKRANEIKTQLNL
jgi:hypothetical protein